MLCQARRPWKRRKTADRNVRCIPQQEVSGISRCTSISSISPTMSSIDHSRSDTPAFMAGARVLMNDLSSRLAHKVQLTTGGYIAYLKAVDEAFGDVIDHAMLAKLYGESPEPKGRTL